MFEGLFGGGENSQWAIMIPLLVLIVFSMYSRRRRAEGTDVEIASSLLSDINENLRAIQQSAYQKKPKKFKVGSWQRNNAKLGFLEPAVHADISKAFEMAENMNEQLAVAKKQKSDAYLSGVDIHKLEGPLTQSRDSIQEWIRERMKQQGPDANAGRRGCMGGGFGS